MCREMCIGLEMCGERGERGLGVSRSARCQVAGHDQWRRDERRNEGWEQSTRVGTGTGGELCRVWTVETRDPGVEGGMKTS